eukprot:768494-Hanusia_phi.AAC.6
MEGGSPLQHQIASASTQAGVRRVELPLGYSEVKRFDVLSELKVHEAPGSGGSAAGGEGNRTRPFDSLVELCEARDVEHVDVVEWSRSLGIEVLQLDRLGHDSRRRRRRRRRLRGERMHHGGRVEDGEVHARHGQGSRQAPSSRQALEATVGAVD